MNEVTLAGKLGKDPEIRYFESGTSKASFSLAINGRKKDEVHWVECEAWGKTGEIIANYCKKGNFLVVAGSLKQEKWEKDGQNRSKIIVNVDRVTLAPKPAAAVPAGDAESWDDEPF